MAGELGVADLEARLAARRIAWAPPPRLTLSAWADAKFYLSPESAAEPGRWHSLPYQRGIMDAITDPRVERVSWQKSTRLGATKIMTATVGYYMEHDPCPLLVVQPTVEDAKGFSKEELAPMLRDCPALTGLVRERKGRTAAQTLLAKTFRGGVVSMVGANSPRGFRRISRKVVFFDEVDAYPASAGDEGDPIELGIKRTEYYADRKIIAASTPTLAGASRIEQLYEQGDRRRYHVPCPQCGTRDILVFRRGERGHWLRWAEDDPDDAHFVCSGNGCVIEHRYKRQMLERGEWIADGAFAGHASFHLWSAYSMAPNTTWADIAREFLKAKGKAETLQVFTNTWLAETFQARGEAPDYERLYERREDYPIGVVPEGVVFLTAGVDVQIDRLPYEVVGWGANGESWSVEAGELYGDTADEATWHQLDALLERRFAGAGGAVFPIAVLAVDSGFRTQVVYNWARAKPMNRVLAVKGVEGGRMLVGTPTAVDVTARGRRLQRGYRVWPVAGELAKTELYGQLRLPKPLDGEPYPAGYCHFPHYGVEFFRQLTAEHLVPVITRRGYRRFEWALLAGRQNHALDARVYARAAAAVHGLDRLIAAGGKVPAPPAKPKPSAPAPAREPGRGSGFISPGRGRPSAPRGGGWFGKRR